MCILFVAINQHPQYPLIVAANRDEFHQRATQSAHIWQTTPSLLAGRDLHAGGTWLGINHLGQFSALTNIRSLPLAPAGLQSRGQLVPKALASPSQVNQKWLTTHAQDYAPFNLLYQQHDDMFCFNSQSQQTIKLTSGFHAICNGDIFDKWPKMTQGEQAMEALVKQQRPLDPNAFFALLNDQSQAPDELLPNTGIGLEWERMLSSIFILSPDYGTRSSALILKQPNQVIDFYEQSYQPDGNIFNRQHFQLSDGHFNQLS
ncbi:NRDE family protein [Thalassotalea aquiviva]|uniref:NRDE family protein n=1 Tax=Thalassotalea aquiviva TaxID=3242415 RepID=UPI00352B794D